MFKYSNPTLSQFLFQNEEFHFSKKETPEDFSYTGKLQII